MARKHLMVLIILLTTACGSGSEPPAPAPLRPSPRATDQRPPGLLLKSVIDSRTVEFPNGVKARISLLAAPAACWSAAALAFARTTLLNKPVRFSSINPGEVNLELADGTDYAFRAVRQGVLRAQGAAGPLADAETAAAREKLGLWGPPCNGQDTAVPTAGVNGFRSPLSNRKILAFDGVRRPSVDSREHVVPQRHL
ncbi:hypothetical protein [Lentzea sp. NPDC004782]|uniref:hypothetical protein n=1 Tax=Lentzea sp. NPDC004782 TaxID=3154458 RepID=UPI0033A81301